MGTLTQCVFCNRDMNSDFQHCPHCSKLIPKSVSCGVCCETMSNQNAIGIKYSSYSTDISYFLHDLCYKETLKLQTCHICNYLFSEQEQANWQIEFDYNKPSTGNIICPNCKTTTSIYRCNCGLFDTRGNARKRRGDDSGHPTCLINKKAAKIKSDFEFCEKLRKEWLEAGKCVKCGGTLGFWSKFFGKKDHFDCDAL